MTSKEFVKERFPHAIVEHHKTNDPFDKKGYWLCWSHWKTSEHIRLSEGKSKSNAWVKAKENILRKENEKRTAGTI